MPGCSTMEFWRSSSVLIDASKYFLGVHLLQIATAHNEYSKKFRTARDLIAHLKAPIHNREPVWCDTCLNKFSSKAALVQHMESSLRCGVRDSDGFRPTLAKLTGGILDTEPMSALEDKGNPEQMVRDMGKIIVDPRVAAELAPPDRVPGLEPKDGQKPAAGQEAMDWGRPAW